MKRSLAWCMVTNGLIFRTLCRHCLFATAVSSPPPPHLLASVPLPSPCRRLVAAIVAYFSPASFTAFLSFYSSNFHRPSFSFPPFWPLLAASFHLVSLSNISSSAPSFSSPFSPIPRMRLTFTSLLTFDIFAESIYKIFCLPPVEHRVGKELYVVGLVYSK